MTYTYNSMQWYYYAYAFFLRTQMCFDVLILIFSSLVHITRAPSLSPRFSIRKGNKLCDVK